MCDSDSIKNAIQAVAVIVGGISAGFGLLTYRHNTRTKAAEFLFDLHQSFFVDETYKSVRNVLDDDSETASTKLSRLIANESAQFTDFLNFFELVAYLRKEHTLSDGDVEALLGYYLQILSNKPELRAYIRNKKKGFEQLDQLLTKREAKPELSGA